jgi:CHASE1-domain containing sensor protein
MKIPILIIVASLLTVLAAQYQMNSKVQGRLAALEERDRTTLAWHQFLWHHQDAIRSLRSDP